MAVGQSWTGKESRAHAWQHSSRNGGGPHRWISHRQAESAGTAHRLKKLFTVASGKLLIHLRRHVGAFGGEGGCGVYTSAFNKIHLLGRRHVYVARARVLKDSLRGGVAFFTAGRNPRMRGLIGEVRISPIILHLKRAGRKGRTREGRRGGDTGEAGLLSQGRIKNGVGVWILGSLSLTVATLACAQTGSSVSPRVQKWSRWYKKKYDFEGTFKIEERNSSEGKRTATTEQCRPLQGLSFQEKDQRHSCISRVCMSGGHGTASTDSNSQ